MTKLLAFDLDGTLAPSKSSLPPKIAATLGGILARYEVCVISGGKFGQFETQLIDGLDVSDELMGRLHVMPTCGTRYYRYEAGSWTQQYAEDFSPEDKALIIAALNEGIDALGLRESTVYGEIIEDRGSQITFSALGQDIAAVLGDEGVRLKERWDPDHAKKRALRDRVAQAIPQFEVRVGGGTSIDITKPGIGKAYGMTRLMQLRSLEPSDIIFFGDRLEEGGNDYPVRRTGIETVAVTGWEDTDARLQAYLRDD